MIMVRRRTVTFSCRIHLLPYKCATQPELNRITTPGLHNNKSSTFIKHFHVKKSANFCRVTITAMKIVEGKVYLSASDLSTHIACPHATFLNLEEAKGLRKAPVQ